MMSLESISIIVFLGLLGTLAYLDRKNIEIKYGVIFRRTGKGKKWIENTAKKHRNLLIKFGNISIIIALLLSLLGFIYLFKNLITMAIEPETKPAVKFVLPELPIKGICTHIFCVPFWFWIISIFVIITPHELSHGFLMAVDRIRIKSLGLILFLVFPGAFVEPDEKQFEKIEPIKKMRVSAVGSIANTLIGVLLVLLLIGLIRLGLFIFESKGVEFTGTINGTPAEQVNLSGIITEIDNQTINGVNDLQNVMDTINPGDTINVVTTEGKYTIKTIQNPDNSSKSFIGISGVSTKLDYRESFKFLGDSTPVLSFYHWVFELFTWIMFLSINIAIANLLPFLPFDGGVLWSAIFEKYFKNRSKLMIKVLSIFTYILVILNIVGLQNILRLFYFPYFKIP